MLDTIRGIAVPDPPDPRSRSCRASGIATDRSAVPGTAVPDATVIRPLDRYLEIVRRRYASNIGTVNAVSPCAGL